MKTDIKIIEALNDILTAELTAINQYFIHGRMLSHWGFIKIGEYIRKQSIDEMKHARLIIDRILFLEGVPNMQRYNKVRIGETVVEQFKLDLDEENSAVKRLRDSIKLCRDLADNGTEDLLVGILKNEEEHVDWLETQLELIEKLGESNYLSQQLEEK